MYKRKTVDRYDLMSNYGYGWECEVSYDKPEQAKEDLKAYRENGGGQYRLEKHRERIEK